MIVNRERGKGTRSSTGKEGREHGEGKRREGNAQIWKEGDLHKSQTPQAASGRERGKGKAGRESGKGMEGREHSYTKHVISTELILNMWRDLCWVYALEINDLEIKRFRDQTTT